MDSSKPQPAQTLNSLLREMEALAVEAREVAAGVPKCQKLDLTNPRGWLKLQEATYSEEFATHLSEKAVGHLRRLCAGWWQRYHKLRFVTATRPVWNT